MSTYINNFFGFNKREVELCKGNERQALVLNYLLALIKASHDQDSYKVGDIYYAKMSYSRFLRRFPWMKDGHIVYCLKQLIAKGLVIKHQNKIDETEYEANFYTVRKDLYDELINEEIDKNLEMGSKDLGGVSKNITTESDKNENFYKDGDKNFNRGDINLDKGGINILGGAYKNLQEERKSTNKKEENKKEEKKGIGEYKNARNESENKFQTSLEYENPPDFIISDFEEEDEIIVLLKALSPQTQKDIMTLYDDADFVKREFLKMNIWLRENKRKAPKSNYTRFVMNWLERGWESYRKGINSTPLGIRANQINMATMKNPYLD